MLVYTVYGTQIKLNSTHMHDFIRRNQNKNAQNCNSPVNELIHFYVNKNE